MLLAVCGVKSRGSKAHGPDHSISVLLVCTKSAIRLTISNVVLATSTNEKNLTLYWGTGLRIARMRIGELSAKAGVNVQTIRFYEREKLLRKPVRTLSGYRIFAEADLERVRFIKQSQQLGFTLKEVKELMEIHESAKSFTASAQFRSREWEKAFKIAKERLDLINQKIQFLKVLKKPLAAVLDPGEHQKEMICPASMLECPASGQTRKRTRTSTRSSSHPSKKSS